MARKVEADCLESFIRHVLSDISMCDTVDLISNIFTPLIDLLSLITEAVGPGPGPQVSIGRWIKGFSYLSFKETD